jgi:hypothetical protein
VHHENAYLTILRRPSAKTIRCNILQPVKADDRIFQIGPAKMTSSSLSQFIKQDLLTKSTFGGNVILRRLMHDEKADFPILRRSSGKIISVIFVQWQKAYSSISVTDVGIVKEDTLLHPKNVSAPIFFSFGERTNEGMHLQLKKTLSGNSLTFLGITIGVSKL